MPLDLRSISTGIAAGALSRILQPQHIHKNGQIDSLKALTSLQGHQKPTHFKVHWNAPPVMTAGNQASGHKYTAIEQQLIRVNTFSVGIPSASYLTYDWVSKGVPIKVPYQKAYADLITNHYVDESGVSRSFFQDWHEAVMDNDTQDFAYMEDYLGSVVIEQVDKEDVQTARWVLDGLWPTIIGAEALAYDANDTLLTFDVTWTYNILQLTYRQN